MPARSSRAAQQWVGGAEISLVVAVSRPTLVCTPPAQEEVDRFGFSALPPVRPTIARLPYASMSVTSGHPLLLLRHWLCSIRRRMPEHPFDSPCRTKHRNESWALASLCRATPSATSERLPGLLDSTSIPPSSSLLAFPFKRGPFLRQH